MVNGASYRPPTTLKVVLYLTRILTGVLDARRNNTKNCNNSFNILNYVI